jgi:hypothetical protein
VVELSRGGWGYMGFTFSRGSLKNQQYGSISRRIIQKYIEHGYIQ